MDTLKAIARRKSTRNFKPDQLREEDVETLLRAACAAPVAHGEYHALHLTLVQDPDVLTVLKDAAMDCFRDPIRDIYYGAPTVIVISSSHGSIPELDMANAGTIAQTMMLAATSLEIDCCYVWGTVLAVRADSDLMEDLQLPEGYEPIASVAFGYAAEPDESEKPMAMDTITINRI